ncbi:zinc-ribbon domain-containing protein [Streptomyces sp. KK5PA1]|uniref:Zinc-ribbon domain-containing protein n=2 Tax=Actinacidiphila acididurans TaxID=2784346 RepID=A0ABS2TZ92_9ACTN|nr:zinc-ribbon domain-containing protein [Actinacidiphila acididurans]
MLILFGTRSYLYRLAMITLLCGACGNPAAHTLRKRVMKFTLFFVPLFPISTKYSTQCTFCGAEHALPKEQAEQLRLQAQGQPQPAQSQAAAPQAYGQGGGQGAPYQGNPYQN